MEKFSRTMRGYDPEEVNNFLDKVINQVETMVNEINEKDKKIKKLQSMEVQNKALQDKLLQYERMEGTLNKAIIMAEKTSEQIKINAHNEAESVLEDAKKNANRIINEALLRAEKTENEANLLKRNTTIFKKRVREIVETQLKVVDELDEIEL